MEGTEPDSLEEDPKTTTPNTYRAQVIEVNFDHAILRCDDIPGGLIYASQPALTLPGESSTISSLLHDGDFVTVQAQFNPECSKIPWSVIPETVVFESPASIYEGIAKIFMKSENNGYLLTNKGPIVFEKDNCKYGPLGFADSGGATFGNYSFQFPPIRNGEMVRFRAQTQLDGNWKAVSMVHLQDDLKAYGNNTTAQVPDGDIKKSTTVLLEGRNLPPFANQLDGLLVTAVNNKYLKSFPNEATRSGNNDTGSADNGGGDSRPQQQCGYSPLLHEDMFNGLPFRMSLISDNDSEQQTSTT